MHSVRSNQTFTTAESGDKSNVTLKQSLPSVCKSTGRLEQVMEHKYETHVDSNRRMKSCGNV